MLQAQVHRRSRSPLQVDCCLLSDEHWHWVKNFFDLTQVAGSVLNLDWPRTDKSHTWCHTLSRKLSMKGERMPRRCSWTTSISHLSSLPGLQSRELVATLKHCHSFLDWFSLLFQEVWGDHRCPWGFEDLTCWLLEVNFCFLEMTELLRLAKAKASAFHGQNLSHSRHSSYWSQRQGSFGLV